jgi:hypothetical protein
MSRTRCWPTALIRSTRTVLAFARGHPQRCPDALTRSVLGLSATAYYQAV